MSRRKRSAPADLGDDSEEDEPITQTLRKRGGRQVSEEAQEDDAEHDDIGTEEEEAGPSKRSRKSRRQNRNLKSQEVAEGNILEETAAKTKKKSKPKGDRPSKRTNAVEDAQVAGSGESGDDDDIEALEQRGDHYALTAAQATQDDKSDITDAEETCLVRNIMRFMIFHQHQKPGIPVKRQDLTAIIMKAYKGGSRKQRLASRIIAKAQAEFVSICGMELKEVNPELHTRAGTQDGPTVYVLRSLLPGNLRNFARSGPLDLNHSFAMVVAALVTLSGGKLAEDDLQIQLEKIGVILHDRHPALGKPMEQIQSLVQKKYLAESRENGCEGVQRVYAVGDCFMDEVQGDNLAAFIEKVFSHAPMSQAQA